MEPNFREIAQKWQKAWKTSGIYKTSIDPTRPKYYVLDMFPYPSGAGLHVGHPLGYIASDIVSRYKRLKGFNVLHPMGFDAFGLPAEQYAIQTGRHPADTTAENIARYKEQLDNIGFCYDWSREVNTSDPKYYKWTQWIFLQLFKSWFNLETQKAESIQSLIAKFENGGSVAAKGACGEHEAFSASHWKEFSETKQREILMQYRLAYQDYSTVNWCEALGTVLANDEVKDGFSERGGHPVEKRRMRQWFLRITAYAERLLNDLVGLDWTDSMKEMQRNWIGRSEGAMVRFDLSPNPSPQERGASQTNLVQEPQSPYHHATPEVWNALISKAKEMRSNMTPSEKLLWEELRAGRSGLKFRRQHIIDRFIVDFVCLSAGIVIEVDGEIHNDQKEHDEGRTVELNRNGFQVIRFTNEEANSDLHSVVEQIIFACAQRKLYNEIDFIQLAKEDEEGYSATPLSNSQNSTETPPSPRGEGLGERYIEVFTTRPDTIFGVDFLTLAPEHELVAEITTDAQRVEVETYVNTAKNRSERERMADVKRISGVFTGAFAKHPFTGNPIPVWVGDYVLAGYGTGAVMAVPAGDQRDWDFAKHFNIPITEILVDIDISEAANPTKEAILKNSGFLDGLTGYQGIRKAIEEIEKVGIGAGKVNYRLRDAGFSRQRYWGEPFPIVYRDGAAFELEEGQLPLELPVMEDFRPTGQPESPLAKSGDWLEAPEGKRETDTMPGYAGSSWYFLRYMDANNDETFVGKEAEAYWQDVDLYIGGTEHAVGHLLYSRFWQKVLFDLGHVTTHEPFRKLINQGMILGRSNFVYRINAAIVYQGEPKEEEKLKMEDLPSVFLSKELAEIWLDNKIEASDFRKIDVFEKIEVTFKRIGNEFCEKLNKSGSVLYESMKVSPLHVDVNMVKNDILDQEAFRNWRPEFAGVEFITNAEGNYVCGVEVEKMSKSKYNVVNPDDIISEYGADTLRLYEMFLGPLEQYKPWNTNGIEGVYRFFKKLWNLFYNDQGGLKLTDDAPSENELRTLHKTIRKVEEDIERFSFNTSVSTFMICVNELHEMKCNKKAILKDFLIVLSPYAPHIAEELWSACGETSSVINATYPAWNEAFIKESSVMYPVAFNGKTRFQITVTADMPQAEVQAIALANEESQKWLNGAAPKKVIVVPGRMVNIVM